MQTFLPYPSFARSARVLDRQRLGKQRVETLQILRILSNVPSQRGPYARHPAVIMWTGYEIILALYGLVMCAEWRRRGYQDTCASKILNIYMSMIERGHPVADPPWLGSPRFHRSHRSNLLRKDRGHYEEFFEPNLPDDLDYVWPG